MGAYLLNLYLVLRCFTNINFPISDKCKINDKVKSDSKETCKITKNAKIEILYRKER